MLPVVLPEEMASIDAAAPESLEELIDRAGRAVMSEAFKMLGGEKKCRGKKVIVIAGKGNNGADGKKAAELLSERKIDVEVISLAKASKKIFAEADLVIDAAYGTGLKRPYKAPAQELISEASILAVDIPSGVDGLTGEIPGSALKADRTITFAALKPGHLLFPGSSFSGKVQVADIGLDVSSANIWLLTKETVADSLPARTGDAHKWNSACWIVGGSPGMTGSVSLAALGAYRSGAGYIRMSVPSSSSNPAEPTLPIEAVGYSLPSKDWGDEILKDSERFKSVVIGPGLGMGIEESKDKHTEVEKVLSQLEKPLVIDGDGLSYLALSGADLLKPRKIPAILTPHDGEFERLTGKPPGADRIQAVRELAAKYNSIVLLKGATTLVAHPTSQEVLISTEGDERLATAGTGDVLAGIIGAFLAQGVEPFMAAAMGAYIHGMAASLGSPYGFMASDLGELIPQAFKSIKV